MAMKNIGIELDPAIRPPLEAIRGGTYEGWQTAIAAAIAVEDCPHWILGAASGFAGPILGLCQFDTCGLCVSGPTSRGKTGTLALGVSAWSNPRLTSGGLLRSMNTTQNAIELSARQSNHLILGLDELAHVDGQTVGRTLYFLSGGVGKARMTAQLTPRESHVWRTFVLLLSEQSLAQKMAADGARWTGGMAVRFPDVDCSEVNANVPKDTMEQIGGIYRHFGDAGGRFIGQFIAKGLHRDPDKLRVRVLDAAANLAGAHADGTRRRAALPFALIGIGGGLAREFGILPKDARIDDAVNWGWQRYASSIEARALNPQALALANLRRWIAERWDIAIKHVSSPYRTSREAVGWYDDNAIYIPVARIGEAIDGVLSVPAFARLLDRAGLLWTRTSSQRAAIRQVPTVGKVDVYALNRMEFRG
jgi:hypothetical protein